MKKIIFLNLVLSMMIACTQKADDKTQLETSYKAFLSAMNTKDVEKLKSTLSSPAYMMIKNQMVSSGSKFPESFYPAVAEMQDLDKLTFQKTFINGATANAVYTGKDEYDEVGVYIFKFLQEDKIWKFNLAEHYSSDSIRNKIASSNFTFLSDKKYQPDGIVPAVPKEIIAGEYVAMIDITAYDYEVEVTVNGNTQPKTTGGSRSGLLMGGLKKGQNTIVITAKPLKSTEESPVIDITIRAQINGSEKEVFVLKGGDALTVITKEFVVE